MAFPIHRPRRLRMNPTLRNLIRPVQLTLSDFVLPLFIRHGNQSQVIKSMPGHEQLCLNDLSQALDKVNHVGIQAIILFGIPAYKDDQGSAAFHDQGIIQQAIRMIKKNYSNLLVIADVCFCEYMDHGHCGIINNRSGQWDIDNDATLELIAKQALSFAQAGVDVVAPSGNIDGMVHAIRSTLDKHHFIHIPILSYSTKYASALYAPFRDAAESAPAFGDRNTYQMDPGNEHEALKETAADLEEGADMVMVKPAVHYLDIIYRVKQRFPEVPLGAYHVSGEFAMIKAAAQQGWIDEKKVVLETLIAIKRAGADFIITYYAKEAATWLQD